MRLWGNLSFLIVGFLLGGCSYVTDEPGTGAKACVQTFFEGIIEQDWPKAYKELSSKNQKAITSDQFISLAQSYRRHLNFEPDAVHIRACQEHDSEATAHVVLTGRKTNEEGRYREALTLRRGPEGWGIVLPRDFGRESKHWKS